MGHNVNDSERSTVAHWDDIYKKTIHHRQLYLYNQQLFDVIERSLGQVLEGKKILEIGCGKAKESIELAKRGAEVVGVDYSANAVELLKTIIRETSSPLQVLQCDGRELPFPDDHFDLVFSQGVIEHFDDPLPLLKEQYRVLKPGGTIVVEVPNRYTIYTVYKKILMFFDHWPPGWETEYSPAQLRCVLRNAGFRSQRIVGWDTFVLRACRKIGKIMGVPERIERPWQKRFRRRIEGNVIVTWLSLSLTIVGNKPEPMLHP